MNGIVKQQGENGKQGSGRQWRTVKTETIFHLSFSIRPPQDFALAGVDVGSTDLRTAAYSRSLASMWQHAVRTACYAEAIISMENEKWKMSFTH